jgi:RNA polymerase sigma-70 factor (ECF subfamily)
MDDDVQLLHAWRDGDAEAGNRLLRRHFRTVYRFFRSKLDDGVDDLIQRTFLGCVEAVDRFREDASFKTFLLAIARNQLLLHFRERAQTAKRDPGEISVAALLGPGSPSTFVAAREEQRILLTALRALPLDLQITVELYYWERLSVAQIGAVLEIPPGTVKSRLARARDNLRQNIRAVDARPADITATLDNLDGWAASLRDALLPEGTDSESG